MLGRRCVGRRPTRRWKASSKCPLISEASRSASSRRLSRSALATGRIRCWISPGLVTIHTKSSLFQPFFRFLPLRDGHPCSLADAKLLYQAMNEDLSATMDASGPSQRHLLLSQYCHVGQPGQNSAALGGNAGALGVSADARLVSENRSRGDEESAIGGLRPNIAKMRIVFDRLQFLLD
jgi:hypothetical protein